ncbi:hypothetical protein SNL152K_4286 [Streptomyces sp. NL15-2K]|nr:hypothetical protein SNL152K_4286 [Streptomyces sp. NL15-2K]
MTGCVGEGHGQLLGRAAEYRSAACGTRGAYRRVHRQCAAR